MAHVSRKVYWQVFVWLTVLTILEVAVAFDVVKNAVGHGVVGGALVALAIAKAAMVGLFYMHLKHETKWLQWSVAIPMAMPAVYALILVAEAVWRLASGTAHPL